MKKDSLQPYLWMLIGTFAFSWMAFLTTLAALGGSWQITALVRSLVPLVVVAAWAKLDGVRLVFWGPPVLWMRSVAGSLSLIGCFYALSHMPASEVYTLSNTFPIWVALLSWPLLGEIPSPAVWLSVLSGVLGVALVQWQDVDGLKPAAVAVLIASMFTALAMMGLHRLKQIDPRAVVVHFSAVATLFCMGAVLVLPAEAPIEFPGPQQLVLLLGVGLTATVGQFFLTKAFTGGAPARVSVVGLTQIVFVLLLEVTLLGRSLDPVKVLGVLLIMAPTAWIMLQKKRRNPAPAPTKPTLASTQSPLAS